MVHFIRQLCTFALIVFVTLPVSATTTIRLTYSDLEAYPFLMGNGSEVANPPGLALDVLDHVASKLDLKIEYVRLPGKRALQNIDSGHVDGGFIFSYNAQRAQYARYPMNGDHPDGTKRIATIGYYFYTLADHSLDWDGENLADTEQQIGAHLGFSIVNELKKKQLKVQEVKTTEQLFQMLELKRISAMAIQDTMAEQYIAIHSLSNVKLVEPAITTKDYYLVFSHQFMEANAGLAEKIWREIEQVRDDVYAKQKDKYLK